MMRRVLATLCAVLVAAALMAGDARAASLRVALVRDPGGGAEADGAREYLDGMKAILDRAGMPYAEVSEDEMIGGALDAFAVAIIPYAPNLGAPGQAALRAFCDDGGKVMCFYKTYGLDRELGLAGRTYVASPDRKLFCRVRSRPGVLAGLPDGFAQVSWNISAPRPAEGTLVLAEWLTAEGKESGHAAATLSDTGFFFSHVLIPQTEQDQVKAGRMLRAVAQYLAARRGRRRDVAIVRGTASEAAGIGDSDLVPVVVDEMGRMLDAVAMPYTVLPDEAVARGALRGRRVAILPLNFRLAPGEAQALRAFSAAGGKVVACFSVHSDVWPLVGVAAATFRAGGASSPFQVVRFNAGAPPGMPESFSLGAGNTMAAVPAPGARAVANWFDAAGRDTGVPAVILCDTGMYFAYVLRGGDLARTSRFMLAGIAHLAGEDFYEAAAQTALARLWDFRRYRDRDELAEASRRDGPAQEKIAEAARLEAQGRAELARGRPADAYNTLRDARAAAELAFVRRLPSRGGQEFRGAWIHSVSIPGQDWDAFFAGMKRAHLNALLPNVCSAGSADYESDVLPPSAFLKEKGPQVRRMLDSARRHGVEVHLWRVNFRMTRASRDLIRKYTEANRVCLDPKGNVVGGPNGPTLCPSHPENQRREIDAMLEMTRKFRPDGIHFDYIRYPNSTACYGSGCRRRFEKRIGRAVADWPRDVLDGGPLRAQYLQFRRDQITTVVREVSRRSREIAPEVKISAAVFSDWPRARDTVGQDWVLWVKKGYLDFVCPMNYTQDVDALGNIVADQRRWIGRAVPLMSGIGAWRSASAWHTADLVDTARWNGADGLVFFEYRGRVAGELIPALLEGPFREQAVTPWAE